MKKIIIGAAAVAAAAAVFVVLTVVKLRAVPEGYNDIKSARRKYESLKSARLEMTDLSSGSCLMRFCFYINTKNEMVLDYDDPQSGEHAYSDGLQFYYRTERDGEWTAITPQNEEYIHNIYNAEYRYPYARGTVFFLDGTAVKEAKTEQSADGGKSITYIYDCDRLNDNAAQTLGGSGSFNELTCVYTINADGCMSRFTETGSITDNEGVTTRVNIAFTVTDMNAVGEIDVPF